MGEDNGTWRPVVIGGMAVKAGGDSPTLADRIPLSPHTVSIYSLQGKVSRLSHLRYEEDRAASECWQGRSQV